MNLRFGLGAADAPAPGRNGHHLLPGPVLPAVARPSGRRGARPPPTDAGPAPPVIRRIRRVGGPRSVPRRSSRRASR
ncbi:hypothetical protein FRAAL1953 [Frankia alni ACN14a]|uniref:Uncharacterized protein n=1 Tax=Frankia alni (strain DSM 45986 / CECT 9034 / ACN14a) TaxID=326424 RepID=Q0RPD0_FRAAA|nr:hypothetical protein FRAAL1953 [Frankia alni ACN14a]